MQAMREAGDLLFQPTPRFISEGNRPPHKLLRIEGLWSENRGPIVTATSSGSKVAAWRVVKAYRVMRSVESRTLQGGDWRSGSASGQRGDETGQTIKGPSKSSEGLIPWCSI